VREKSVGGWSEVALTCAFFVAMLMARSAFVGVDLILASSSNEMYLSVFVSDLDVWRPTLLERFALHCELFILLHHRSNCGRKFLNLGLRHVLKGRLSSIVLE